jgi:hypothetical protein
LEEGLKEVELAVLTNCTNSEAAQALTESLVVTAGAADHMEMYDVGREDVGDEYFIRGGHGGYCEKFGGSRPIGGRKQFGSCGQFGGDDGPNGQGSTSDTASGNECASGAASRVTSVAGRSAASVAEATAARPNRRSYIPKDKTASQAGTKDLRIDITGSIPPNAHVLDHRAFVVDSYVGIDLNSATIQEDSLLMEYGGGAAIVCGSLNIGSKEIKAPYDHRGEEEDKRRNSPSCKLHVQPRKEKEARSLSRYAS